ncbi:MAG: hypothetical protein MJ066_01185, partial [Clostridia bacterium]|nr:hypothetical protein [Clostridia bacterium]
MTKTVKKCLFAFFMALLMLVVGAVATLSNVKSANAGVSLTDEEQKIISAANIIKKSDCYVENSGKWNVKATNPEILYLVGFAKEIENIDYSGKEALNFGDGEIKTLDDVSKMFDDYDAELDTEISVNEFINACNSVVNVVGGGYVSYRYLNWKDALVSAFNGFSDAEKTQINTATGDLAYLDSLEKKLGETKTRIEDTLTKMKNLVETSSTTNKIDVNLKSAEKDNLLEALASLRLIYSDDSSSDTGIKKLEATAINLSNGKSIKEKDIIADMKHNEYSETFGYLYNEFNLRYTEYLQYNGVIASFEKQVADLYKEMYVEANSKLDKFIASKDEIASMQQDYSDLATTLSTYSYFKGDLQPLVKSEIKNSKESELGKYDQIVAGLAKSNNYISQWNTESGKLKGIVDGNTNAYYQETVKAQLESMDALLVEIGAHDSSIELDKDYYNNALTEYNKAVNAIASLKTAVDNSKLDSIYGDFDSKIGNVYEAFCANQKADFDEIALAKEIVVGENGYFAINDINEKYVENYKITTYGDLVSYLKGFKTWVGNQISKFSGDISGVLGYSFTYEHYVEISKLYDKLGSEPDYIKNAARYDELETKLNGMKAEIAKAAESANLVNKNAKLLAECEEENHVYTYPELATIGIIYAELVKSGIIYTDEYSKPDFTSELFEFVTTGENLTNGVDQYNPYYDEYKKVEKAMTDFIALYDPSFVDFVNALEKVTVCVDEKYVAKVPDANDSAILEFISNYNAVKPLADAFKVEEGVDYKEYSSVKYNTKVKYNTNDFFNDKVVLKDEPTNARGRYKAYLTINIPAYVLEMDIDDLFTSDAVSEYEELNNQALETKVAKIGECLKDKNVSNVRDSYAEKLDKADDAIQEIIGNANAIDSWVVAGMGDYAVKEVLKKLGIEDSETAIKKFFTAVNTELKAIYKANGYNVEAFEDYYDDATSLSAVQKAAKAYIENHIVDDAFKSADYTDLNANLAGDLEFRAIVEEHFESKFFADVNNFDAYLTSKDGIAYIIEGIATFAGKSIKATDTNKAMLDFFNVKLPTEEELKFKQGVEEDVYNLSNYDLSTLKLVKIEKDFFEQLKLEFESINSENYYNAYAKTAYEKISEILEYSENLSDRLIDEIAFFNTNVFADDISDIDMEDLKDYKALTDSIQLTYRAMDDTQIDRISYTYFDRAYSKLMWKMYYLEATNKILEEIARNVFTTESQISLDMLGTLYNSASDEYRELIKTEYYKLVEIAFPAYEEADVKNSEIIVDERIKEKLADAIAKENAKDNELSKAN